MEWFKDSNINFQQVRRPAMMLSALTIAAGILVIILQGGLNYSIDFLGGTAIQLRFEKPVSEGEIRAALTQIDMNDSEVLRIAALGEDPEILIRTKKSEISEASVENIKAAIRTNLPDNPFEVRAIDAVGPKMGSELRTQALLATLIALGGILIYISIRFEFIFALAAVLAIFHDVVITIGLFSILGKEISLAIIAAFLTIVGYSLNDTIVVFDRVRENLKRMRAKGLEEVINTSINQTLSRTIVTGVTTLLALVVLYIFGGSVIRDFTLAIIVGVVIGTYSSIYIASPILIEWGARAEKLQKRKPK
ncbi:protein translocase subunit SecF [candidate division LCP-89 bacterium B3_LCP]|uniref:Protein-export membrane protein SecF n=1 Tax=candidate division LCP-89 bacterium B3_LCP TaxID=2012998 RepID=A0A532UUW5_UNCL8|nr:MAG: protein translocase subunit SecF [candidate division LCP-89 bacterium B3_LCP]